MIHDDMLAHTSAQTNRQTDKRYRDVDPIPVFAFTFLTHSVSASSCPGGWLGISSEAMCPLLTTTTTTTTKTTTTAAAAAAIIITTPMPRGGKDGNSTGAEADLAGEPSDWRDLLGNEVVLASFGMAVAAVFSGIGACVMCVYRARTQRLMENREGPVGKEMVVSVGLTHEREHDRDIEKADEGGSCGGGGGGGDRTPDKKARKFDRLSVSQDSTNNGDFHRGVAEVKGEDMMKLKQALQATHADASMALPEGGDPHARFRSSDSSAHGWSSGLAVGTSHLLQVSGRVKFSMENREDGY